MVRPTNSQGSFGIPQDVMDAVGESKAKAKGKTTKKKAPLKKEKETYDSESIPEEDLKPDEEDARVEKEEQIKQTEKDLGVEITEDDLWEILMGNQLVKKGIAVVPGRNEVTFRTLSMDESEAVDASLAAALEEKLLDAGLRNRQTRLLLSYGIVELGKTGKAKSLGKTQEERFAHIGKMNTLLVEKLALRWNQFTWLVGEKVNGEMDSGKS